MKQETKTKELTKEFNYNDKLMSLTKQRIINISKDLYVTISLMQKEIDLYKEKYNKEKNNYFLKTKENSNLIKDINSTKDYSQRVSEQYNLLKETNNKLNDTYIESKIEINKSLKEQIKYIDKCTKYTRQNTMLFKELIFLKNRNLFKRIFNVQYKTNDN
jgi:hypothetical protein